MTIHCGTGGATARMRQLVASVALVAAIAASMLVAHDAAAGGDVGRGGATESALLSPGDPNFQCAFAKQKAALRRVRAINACLRTPPQLGGQAPNPRCIENAERRFEREYAGIESRGGCIPATGDRAIVEDIADECAIRLTLALPGICQPAGELCGGSNPPCCDGLQCRGVIGQPPRCG